MNLEALDDTLNLCAQAVDEAGSGRPTLATVAWLKARTAAEDTFGPGTNGAKSLAAIVDAAAPSRAGAPWRTDLWRALGTASLASLTAADGDTGFTDTTLLDASGLAANVPCRGALAVILTAIWDLSRSEVTA